MRMLRRLKDESGQAMIVTLLSMGCLLGAVGFATDVGVLFHAKRHMQIAADSAAIAGATQINYNATGSIAESVAAGQAAGAQNGVGGSNAGTVTINDPPVYGAFAGKSGYVEAIVSQSQPTFFMNIFGHSATTVSARAVATLGSSQSCIYTLGGSGTDLQVTGNSDISIPNCGIVDDSSSNAAMDLTGNVTLNAQSIGIVGKADDTGNLTIPVAPVTGIAPVGNPLASLPTPTIPSSCSANPNYDGNVTATLSPGCFNGLSGTGNINLTLNPGLYIVNGNFNFSGNISITGTGVTLALLGSTSIPGNTALNLTAPTSGTYNGILIDQPSSNANPLSITGNSGSTMEGIVYAPAATVTFTGNSGSTIYADFVVSSLAIIGNSSFTDYSVLAGNNTPLTSTRLVE